MEEVNVVGRFLDIVQFHDVLVLDGLHDFDLVFQRVVEFLGVFLDARSGDGLDRNQIAVSDISPLVDLTVGTSAYLLVDVDDEGLNEFIIGGSQLGSLLLDLSHLRLIHFKIYKI